jgi:hypothetical protein
MFSSKLFSWNNITADPLADNLTIIVHIFTDFTTNLHTESFYLKFIHDLFDIYIDMFSTT